MPQNPQQDTSTPKEILFDLDALEAIGEGVDRLADTVKTTLGPRGRNVIIERTGPMEKNLVTKDGVTVARILEFDDPITNMGAEIVKEAAKNTASQGGDGTTTSTVLAQAIFHEAVRLVTAGAPAVSMKRGMKKALQHTRAFIAERAYNISSRERVEEVATISANGDEGLGKAIAEATEQVGKDGIISVDQGRSAETKVELTEGVQIERGWVTEQFVNAENESGLTFEEPLVLTIDDDVSSPERILPAMEYAKEQNRGLIVAAHDVSANALAALVSNHREGVLNTCAITVPRITDKRRELLEDLAILGGGMVMSPQTSVSLENYTPAELTGSFGRVNITADESTFLNGDGSEDDVTQRIRDLRTRSQKAGSEYDKEFLQKRISQLSGGMAIIRVGGETEIEMKRRKALVEDALNATQASIRGGVVAGGGYMLLRASMFLDKIQQAGDITFDDDSEKWGWDLLKNSLDAPAKQILRNAGEEPGPILDEMRDYFRAEIGYDVRDGEMKDFYEEGIIDPAIVVEDALISAVSSVSSLIMSGACIAPKRIEE